MGDDEFFSIMNWAIKGTIITAIIGMIFGLATGSPYWIGYGIFGCILGAFLGAVFCVIIRSMVHIKKEYVIFLIIGSLIGLVAGWFFNIFSIPYLGLVLGAVFGAFSSFFVDDDDKISLSSYPVISGLTCFIVLLIVTSFTGSSIYLLVWLAIVIIIVEAIVTTSLFIIRWFGNISIIIGIIAGILSAYISHYYMSGFFNIHDSQLLSSLFCSIYIGTIIGSYVVFNDE